MMTDISNHLKATAEGKSEEFKNYVKETTWNVYKDCTLSQLADLEIARKCFDDGSDILENDIEKYKTEA